MSRGSAKGRAGAKALARYRAARKDTAEKRLVALAEEVAAAVAAAVNRSRVGTASSARDDVAAADSTLDLRELARETAQDAAQAAIEEAALGYQRVERAALQEALGRSEMAKVRAGPEQLAVWAAVAAWAEAAARLARDLESEWSSAAARRAAAEQCSEALSVAVGLANAGIVAFGMDLGSVDGKD